MSAAANRTVLIGAAAIAALATVGLAGFWLGTSQPPQAGAAGDRQVLYWYDPMVPDQHFEKPGKSPFMDMELVPRYAGETETVSAVTISPGVAQNLGVRYATVDRSEAGQAVRASGTLTYNGRELAIVQAKQDGFVERSRNRAVGDIVRAGDPLVDLRVPVWTAALAEYLSLRGSTDAALVAAARRRVGMLGVPADALAAAEASGRAPSVFTVHAPASGALVALDARPGMSLPAGSPVASISGLSPIWLVVSVPQGAIGGLAPGVLATARFPSFPDEERRGRIEAILPGANLANRTVEVRIALDNPGGRLRPGMTGDVMFSGVASRPALSVPSEAVIRTGRRTIVIVAGDDGRFQPTEVTIGAAVGDRLEITAGLSEGQRVVASGQFLIDSEANLTGVLDRLGEPAPAVFTSTGQVTAVDAASVTIAHAPVDALSWPAMTMAFAWGDLPHDLTVGDTVAFSFRKGGTGYVLTAIARTGAPR